MAFWTGLRVQPILSDEVQTFKALITVHKVLQEGHPVVRCFAYDLACSWSDYGLHSRLKKLMDKRDGLKLVHDLVDKTEREVSECRGCQSVCSKLILGYGGLIRTYVSFLLSKLRFHRVRPEFNGLFEYEEYVTLKGIDDPNEG